VRPRHPAPRSTSIDGGLVPKSSRAPHPQDHYPRAVPGLRVAGGGSEFLLASGGGRTRGRWRWTAGSCSSSSSRPPPWPGSPLPPLLSCPVSACWCFLLPILPFPFVTTLLTSVRAWVCRRRVPGDRWIHGEELVAGQEGYVSFSFLLNSSTL